MKEIIFLKKNAEKWERFESIVNNRKQADPDTLAELYVEVTDDLSYARTFFPGSKTIEYLNGLSAKLHQAIYRNKKEERKRLLHFWTKEQPLILFRYRKEILISFLVFIVSASIGILSSANDDSFVRLILGDSYLKMTIENIEKGDPMAVYKSMNQVNMFLGITLNNIKVSVLAFAMGILASIGTGMILFYNGVMLGAFHYFFYRKGLLVTSLLSIWIHGTLEIFAVIISGAAGFIIGNSLLFPGTFSRAVSVRQGARDGIKLIVGVLPVFVMAGFLEGFVTRYTFMPRPVSIGIIALSLLFIIWYYFIYPTQYSKGENSNE